MKRLFKLIKLLIMSLLSLFAVITIVGSGAELFEAYLYDYKGSSVVKLSKIGGYGSGTGFQVKAPSGKIYVLTNAHVCKMGKTLSASSALGTQNVKVIEIYPKHDLCLVSKVEGLRALSVASNYRYHERVWLVGHPAGRNLTMESGHIVGPDYIKILTTVCSSTMVEKTAGELLKSYLREMEDCQSHGMLCDDTGMKQIFKTIQRVYRERMCHKEYSTNHINNISYGGNSGSPVLNKWGNVIGVLFAGRRDQNTASHIVPLRFVQDFLKDK